MMRTYETDTRDNLKELPMAKLEIWKKINHVVLDYDPKYEIFINSCVYKITEYNLTEEVQDISIATPSLRSKA